MARNIAYWASTLMMAAMMTFSGVLYLSGSAQVVTGFAHLGYPQHLRVILGLAKLSGVVVLLIPGVRVLKEWAYAGFTFAWIIATVAHYLAGDGPKALFPAVLLLLLIVSYVTRPESRRVGPAAV
jgi:DoxX-like family